MSEDKKFGSFKATLLVFVTSLLGTSTMLITAGKFKLALISVTVGGACVLVVALVTRIVNWLHPE